MIFARQLRAGLACVMLLASQSAFAQGGRHPKLDRALRDALRTGGGTQHVIITVKAGYRAEIRAALEQHGDKVKSEHPFVDALAVEIHSEDIDELANHPWVDGVSIDAICYAGAAPQSNRKGGASAASLLSQPFAAVSATLRQTLGLPRQSEPYTPSGVGIGVAIVDSGIAPSRDFGSRITAFYDFTRGGIPTAPFDDYGHGTHVAGLIGSGGLLSDNQYQGIAPDVRLVGLKVLDKKGAGKTSDVIKALEYVTANRVRLGVQIVNLSLGHPIYEPARTDPLVQAVEKAVASGLIVVTSAGNYGQNTKGAVGYTGLTSPGNTPSTFTVGAAITKDTLRRGDDGVADYSSRGPTWYDGFAKPDAIAPGHHLTSDTSAASELYAKLANNHKSAKGNPFLELSGTSMAAAVASGLVADVLDAHNRAGYVDARPLTPNAVKAIIEYSAIPVAGADYLSQGAGEVNAAGAIALASAIDAGNLIDCNLRPWGLGVEWGAGQARGAGLVVAKAPFGSQAFVKASNICLGHQHRLGRQHRLERPHPRSSMTTRTTFSGARRSWTTSCGARPTTTSTTSCGARPS